MNSLHCLIGIFNQLSYHYIYFCPCIYDCQNLRHIFQAKYCLEKSNEVLRQGVCTSKSFIDTQSVCLKLNFLVLENSFSDFFFDSWHKCQQSANNNDYFQIQDTLCNSSSHYRFFQDIYNTKMYFSFNNLFSNSCISNKNGYLWNHWWYSHR